MPDGIMVASLPLRARRAIAGPETSNNSLSIAPHARARGRAAASRVLMISFRRCGPCFCPAPRCRLPST